MVPAYSAFDIVDDRPGSRSRGVEETAEVYFDLADRLQIARLRDRIIVAAARRPVEQHGPVGAARRPVRRARGADPGRAGGRRAGHRPAERLAAWTERNDAAVGRATQTLGEIWESERFTFTTLSVALRTIRALVASSSLPHPVLTEPVRVRCP